MLTTFITLLNFCQIHFLEYTIPLSSVPHVFSCAMDLWNREPYHRSAGGKTTEGKNLKKNFKKKRINSKKKN